jgi:hypothetical protein
LSANFLLGSFYFCVFWIGVGEDSIGSGVSKPGGEEHAQGGGFWCLLQGLVLETNTKLNFLLYGVLIWWTQIFLFSSVEFGFCLKDLYEELDQTI